MCTKIDHIAFAVSDLEAATLEYCTHFGLECDVRETVETQQTELQFLRPANFPTANTRIDPALAPTKIELLAPMLVDGVPVGPVAKYLKKRGPGMHHVCYEVSDIHAELARLASAGITLIDSDPRPGAHGTLIAFLHPKSCGGVLTELCQYR